LRLKAEDMPKRILYVHACAGMGGAPLSLLYLIQELDRTRYVPEVLFIGLPGEEVELFRRRRIPMRVRPDITTYPHADNAYLSVRSLRPWEIATRALQILPSARRMRDELRSHPPDLVHINTSVLLPAGLGAVWAGLPVVWHVREPLRRGAFGVRRWFVKTCIDRCSSAVIAISRSDAAPLVQGPKVRVVYNFVDFERFDRLLDGGRFRASLGLSPDRPLFVMLGGLIENKGPDVLAEAAVLVRRRRPDVVFLIAGVPPRGESPSPWRRILRRLVEATGLVRNIERTMLEFIRRHDLGETVRFVGMRSDVPDMLAASAGLVWPAIVPHFSRPIIEAGAMARPVIAADFPSTREMVVPGETGLLFRPGSARELADAILRLLENPEEAGRMGEAGYSLARARHDSRRNAVDVMSIYDEILPEARPGAVAS
jgi:glycosyltransferase involved in cell wall biosynthesis